MSRPSSSAFVTDDGRIEGPSGDLNQFGLDGEIIDLEQARAALAAAEEPA